MTPTLSVTDKRQPSKSPLACIVLEVLDTKTSRHAMEEMLFDLKYSYKRITHYPPNKQPQRGYIFYEIPYEDPAALFYLGVAYKSKLIQL